jgi:SAM-dependent methyltransferase
VDYRDRVYSSYLGSNELMVTGSEGLRTRAPFFRKVIREYLPADRSAVIVDVGCGHGAFLYFARQAGYGNLRGIDISEQQVATARRLGIDGVTHGDLLKSLQALRDDSQDAVITIDVLEHFRKEEVVPLIDEIYRVLRKNGRWIVHVPNGESPFFGRIRYGDFTHELAFTCASIEQLAIACGFKQVLCFEDPPIAHGFKSSLRWLGWKLIRFVLRSWILVETGASGNDSLFTQNLFAIVLK